MRQYIDLVSDLQGNAIVGASILITNFVGGGNAAIFSDNGLTPITGSTVTTDITGQYSFFVADGDYTLAISVNASLYKTLTPVSIFDGASQVTQADTGGAANVYATSSSVLEKQLRTGLRSWINVAHTNTGASTYAYNGLAVKAIVNFDGSALTAGVLAAGGIYAMEYNGTAWQLTASFLTASTIGTQIYPITAAELNLVGVTINTVYPYGNLLRYGVLANSLGAAAANAVALTALFNAAITNGPTGNFYFPNTTGADVYTVGVIGSSCVITVRDGCTIDGNECTLNMFATGNATDIDSGFWFAIRDFTLQNMTINATFVAPASTSSSGNCVQIGARGNESPRWPISIFDASLPVPMGNVTLRNLRLNQLSNSGINLNSVAAVAIIGGVTNMSMDNVVMAGSGNGGVQFALVYEFGYATDRVGGDSGSSTRQSSHMSGFRMTNCSAQNFDNISTSSIAVVLAGAFDALIENFAFSGISNGIAISTGEALNFRPWVGTQAQLGNDAGAKRNIKLINIVGENFSDLGLNLQGATSRLANTGYRQTGWVANHAYINGGGGSGTNKGMTVINGVNAYICTVSGTSAGAGGPTGTGTGIVDNTCTWDYLPLTVNSDLYDFSIDGLALACGATGQGISTTAGHFDLRNATISAAAGNNQSGIILGDECTFFNVENVNVFGMGVEGCRFDFGNIASNLWSPARPKKGTIKNSYFAGNGTSAGAGTFPAISIANCDGVTIDACRFGYETAYSFSTEVSQGSGVNLSSATTCQNVMVKNCRFGGVAGGSPVAVALVGGTNSPNCRFENNSVAGGITNTAGQWLTDSVLSQILATGNTITNSGTSGSYRTAHLSAAGNVTAIKLQAGVYGGQLLSLTNASGFSITFDVQANSNVAEGVANPIATLTGRNFIWDSTSQLWYRAA